MERTLVRLLQSMRTPGITHVVVTLRSPGSLAIELPREVPCYSLGMSGTRRTAGLRLARVLRRLGPCVLHARNPGTWADALLARACCRNARLVLGFHGLETSGEFSMRDRFVAIGARWFAAEFTTVSASGAEKMTRELGIPSDRITVLSNGVDLQRFSPTSREASAAVRAEFGIPADATVVGTVGSLTAVKRQDLLLHAFATCGLSGQKLWLLLVGDGSERGRLEALCRSLQRPATVTFAGARDDIPGLLAGMDVFVNCSDSEGMSNAVLEAMVAGLPVIATRVGGNEELVRDRVDGWLVPRGDVGALAIALREAASDPDLRGRFGVSARARAGQFSFDSTVRAYERFYVDKLHRPLRGNPKGIPAANEDQVRELFTLPIT